MKNISEKLTQKQDLLPEEMTAAMELIVSGKAEDADIERFLVALREKGETVEEITAAARVMRSHAVKLDRKFVDLLDTCGTGGDAKGTVNISTLSSFIAASLGVKVAKHGNRSVSSVCGSADLLEMLGIKTELTPSEASASLNQNNFAFLFAPRFHPAVKFAMPARQRIKGKTLFNLLGPLSNPADASFQVLGVYEPRLVSLMARVLKELGAKRALVVHGSDGLDEITLTGATEIAEVSSRGIKSYVLSPEDFGLQKSPLSDFQCASKEKCLEAALRVIRNETRGALKDVVCLNAGAALYIANRASTIAEGFKLAVMAIDQGIVSRWLDDIK